MTRSVALRGLLCEVQRIAEDTEDSTLILRLIQEAGIPANIHCDGTDPDKFTDDMTVEWVLGQWRDAIQQRSPFLNSFRNVSARYAEEVCGYVHTREPIKNVSKVQPTRDCAAIDTSGRGVTDASPAAIPTSEAT